MTGYRTAGRLPTIRMRSTARALGFWAGNGLAPALSLRLRFLLLLVIITGGSAI